MIQESTNELKELESMHNKYMARPEVWFTYFDISLTKIIVGYSLMILDYVAGKEILNVHTICSFISIGKKSGTWNGTQKV